MLWLVNHGNYKANQGEGRGGDSVPPPESRGPLWLQLVCVVGQKVTEQPRVLTVPGTAQQRLLLGAEDDPELVGTRLGAGARTPAPVSSPPFPGL